MFQRHTKIETKQDLDRSHRFGKHDKTNGRSTPIVIQFATYNKK